MSSRRTGRCAPTTGADESRGEPGPGRAPARSLLDRAPSGCVIPRGGPEPSRGPLAIDPCDPRLRAVRRGHDRTADASASTGGARSGGRSAARSGVAPHRTPASQSGWKTTRG